MVRTLRMVYGVVLVLACIPSFLGADDGGPTLPRETLDRVIHATVFVKTRRVFQRQEFPASGSGVFISPDGYVLTNWHVIADQFSGWIWGKEHEITSKVLSLSVVVDSGTTQEKEIPAVVVARNRKLDLALLRTGYHPKAWVDLSTVPDVSLAQRIWIVGFPYGQMLSSFKDPDTLEPKANPEVSIASGMVTSIRHDKKGDIAAIQIDAPVNPGNSGGPMLDEKGRVVGIVFAKWTKGEGLGLAVPPEHIRRFLSDQLLKVRFRPVSVGEPPSPIHISIVPLLASKKPVGGTATLRGADIPNTTAQFTEAGDGVEVTIPFPERIVGTETPDHYIVVVELVDAGGMRIFRKRYRLKHVETAVGLVRSERDPGSMMEDRRLFGNDMEIRDYLKSRKAAGESPNSLSGMAKKLKLRKTEGGSIVIDNNSVRRIAAFIPDPEAYTALEKEEWRTLCEDYDSTLYRIRKLEKRIEELKNAREVTDSVYGTLVYIYVPWSNERISSSQKKKLIDQHRQEITKARRHLERLGQFIGRVNLVRCPAGKWYRAVESPCGYPVLPRE